MVLEILNKEPKLKSMLTHVKSYELSAQSQKMLIGKEGSFYIIDADSAASASLDKCVDLKGWTFPIEPRLGPAADVHRGVAV